MEHKAKKTKRQRFNMRRLNKALDDLSSGDEEQLQEQERDHRDERMIVSPVIEVQNDKANDVFNMNEIQKELAVQENKSRESRTQNQLQTQEPTQTHIRDETERIYGMQNVRTALENALHEKNTEDSVKDSVKSKVPAPHSITHSLSQVRQVMQEKRPRHSNKSSANAKSPVIPTVYPSRFDMNEMKRAISNSKSTPKTHSTNIFDMKGLSKALSKSSSIKSANNAFGMASLGEALRLSDIEQKRKPKRFDMSKIANALLEKTSEKSSRNK
jgi:hypothetical protein